MAVTSYLPSESHPSLCPRPHQSTPPLALHYIFCPVFLSLNDCDFSGPLPSEMGYLWNMTRLQMKNNLFTGTIPPELGRMDQLEQFTLEGNKLTGEIPPSMCDLLKEKLNQFIVDCYSPRNEIGFNCEPQCCTLCRDVS